MIDLPQIKNINALVKAIETFGMSAQVDMAIEEMSELTKALCKERRYKNDADKHTEAVANVIEEIADVAIMLNQLVIIFDNNGAIQKQADFKIERLEKMLKGCKRNESNNK